MAAREVPPPRTRGAMVSRSNRPADTWSQQGERATPAAGRPSWPAHRHGSDASGPGCRTQRRPPGRRRQITERIAVFRRRRHCGVQCAAGVDDEQVAGREPARQIAEARVLDRIVLDIRHQQPDLVAPETARLRRFGGFESGRQLEVRDYTCCSHRASCRCASNRSPLRSDGA